MPKFLIRVDGQAKYVRVFARDENEVMNAFENGWSHAVAFSSRNRAFQLEMGRAPLPSRQRLPLTVWLAWLGIRFPRVRLTIQLACWLALGLTLTGSALGTMVAPGFLVLTGLANVLAWWWAESDRGHIEPGVHPVQSS